MSGTINVRDAGDIASDIEAIIRICETGALSTVGYEVHLQKAAFVWVLVCLRDLMYKAEKYDSRIGFVDDVITTAANEKPQVRDVTDLIKFVRDAMCHPDIDHHWATDKVMLSFNVVYGKSPRPLITIGGNPMGPTCDYEDDVAYGFGNQRIYLKRHILRALDEAKQKLLPLMPDFYKA